MYLLQVITSKQRPRKLSVRGSNGRTYMFLLKGHEDLRQDERVMQFFSLVNSLLVNDPETFRRNLAIQRFAVIPLSTNSGLIGWVPHSDTLHGLIKDYRWDKLSHLYEIKTTFYFCITTGFMVMMLTESQTLNYSIYIHTDVGQSKIWVPKEINCEKSWKKTGQKWDKLLFNWNWSWILVHRWSSLGDPKSHTDKMYTIFKKINYIIYKRPQR